MLATVRLGAIHVVVFGGFGAKELSVRIDGCKPKLVKFSLFKLVIELSLRVVTVLIFLVSSVKQRAEELGSPTFVKIA